MAEGNLILHAETCMTEDGTAFFVRLYTATFKTRHEASLFANSLLRNGCLAVLQGDGVKIHRQDMDVEHEVLHAVS